ncbi:efflux RND transporter periplasmic adaptor subunit [Pannonibacter sp. SL95]|uniref:efflux RND transporter periplasmic adaptor subunit n=1 Tax=Pannonibacter sp. SL95 TaxID=2995153 RepID=UPI0022751F1B|nr:efflux RND transporter periplasmic adaptor subunit [Pannonibacter sp. SL95]MCY1707481.1 efflux RND transporter periplasmic adaptor subunit [Pannonibacter sp. SL95]
MTPLSLRLPRTARPVMLLTGLLVLASGFAAPSSAADLKLELTEITDWKSVYATVEPSVRVLARARNAGTVVELTVDEGSAVREGDRIARVLDEKLALRRQALNARIAATSSEAANIESEVNRARQLFARGTISQSRIDQLETQLDVARETLKAAEAERDILDQQEREGDVIAATSGRVLSVPVTIGSVILPGEPVAEIAEDGFLLRLELPERHAATTRAGDPVKVVARTGDAAREGQIVKVYPELAKGRVIANAAAEGLGDFFVGERVPVEIGTGTRPVLALPPEALRLRNGLDYVTLRNAAGTTTEVVVQRGREVQNGALRLVEILSGLTAGDVVVLP